eukprot:4516419-Prorocentrum_lima.AAC.1
MVLRAMGSAGEDAGVLKLRAIGSAGEMPELSSSGRVPQARMPELEEEEAGTGKGREGALEHVQAWANLLH